jgi:uncharacterized protein YjiS (DUF1127 family)
MVSAHTLQESETMRSGAEQTVIFPSIAGNSTRRRARGSHWILELVLRPLHFFIALEQRRRERSELADLDDRLLRDIGLTRVEVDAAFERPTWHRGTSLN